MKQIFVFESNMAGLHEKGTALFAKNNYRAVSGVGMGPQGDSYAIPTKDCDMQPLPYYVVENQIQTFLKFAFAASIQHPDVVFFVSPIACDTKYFNPADIAKLFDEAKTLPNVLLSEDFKTSIKESYEKIS